MLLYHLLEVYQLFKEENPDLKIGKSKFISLRPQNILPITDKNHNQCCCIYHENFSLLFQSLKKINNDILSDREFLALCVCSKESLKCHKRECKKCPKILTLVNNEITKKINEKDDLKIIQWTNNCKQASVYSVKQLEPIIINQTVAMLKHHYIAKHQTRMIKDLKKNLARDEIVLQEDFSENFNIKQQNEIMSAHWHKSKKSDDENDSQVAIFTAIVYKTETDYISIVIVTDCLTKDKFTVAACNKKVCEEIEKSTFPLTKIHAFTDGAGGQFKNCYTLSLLTEPTILNSNIEQMDWSFFATAHGKGPIDGLGGTVKRTVWKRILQDKVLINSAEDFAKEAAQNCPNIRVIYLPQIDIDEMKAKLTKHWDQKIPKTIEDTRQLHFFKASADSERDLEVSEVSYFKEVPSVTGITKGHSVTVLKERKIHTCQKK